MYFMHAAWPALYWFLSRHSGENQFSGMPVGKVSVLPENAEQFVKA